MRSECSHLLTLCMAPGEVKAVIDEVTLAKPDITRAPVQWIDTGVQTAELINRPGRYAVEVCWEQAGRITCRTYQVRARSDEEAARKGRSIAKRHALSASRLEIVDLQPLWRTKTAEVNL